MGIWLLTKAYSDKNSFSYWIVSKLLQSKNKFIRKHLTRRLKRKLNTFTQLTKINLGFHPALPCRKTFIECFSSDLNTAAVYFECDSTHVYDLYKQYITDNSIFLDIGANVGIHTLIARAVNDSVDVYAFEPSPDIHARLTRNVENNGTERIHLNQLALSNVEGEIYFDDKSDNANIGTSCISTTPTDLKVDVNTADNFFLNIESRRKVSLIKIDVEGFEPSVLEGAQQLLIRNRPTIILEFNRHHYSIEEITKHIPYKFEIYIVEKSKASPVADIALLNKTHRAKDILIRPSNNA